MPKDPLAGRRKKKGDIQTDIYKTRSLGDKKWDVTVKKRRMSDAEMQLKDDIRTAATQLKREGGGRNTQGELMDRYGGSKNPLRDLQRDAAAARRTQSGAKGPPKKGPVNRSAAAKKAALTRKMRGGR